MPVIKVEGLTIELDDRGYLVSFEDWTEKVACILAEREGVGKTCPLTKEKMDILIFIRKYFKQFNAFPYTTAICRNIHQPGQCVVEEFLDPFKAWKIAGLPEPPPGIMDMLTGGGTCGAE